MGTTVDGVALSDEEIVSTLRNWTAGQGTVAASIGILVYYLAGHADVQQKLRQEPALHPPLLMRSFELTVLWWPIAGPRRGT